jgi:hypothetical protein
MNINDDYLLTSPEPAEGCERAMGLLVERFDQSISHAEWIIDQVMALKEEVGR